MSPPGAGAVVVSGGGREARGAAGGGAGRMRIAAGRGEMGGEVGLPATGIAMRLRLL